jgi:exonuclease VII small subunit
MEASETPTQMTCEQAFERLDEIVAELDGASVERTKELLRHGKAIEKTLRSYLEDTERELKDIEAGESLPPYQIVADSPLLEG